MASVLLVLHVDGPIVAYADDSQVPADQCGGGLSHDACQPQADPARSAPVVDPNQTIDQLNPLNTHQSGQDDTVYA